MLLAWQLGHAAPAPSQGPAGDSSGRTSREAGAVGSRPSNGFSLPGSQRNEPIKIEAGSLEFDARENVAVFRGDVVTTQADVVMRSGLLRVEFARSDATVGSLERLQSVVAEGDVRITQGSRLARGDRAEFNEADRTLVLSGDAVLHEGSNQVRGERIIVYLDENRSVVEGTRTRVKAILVPDGDALEGSAAGAPAPGAAESEHAVAAGSPQDRGSE